MSEALRVVLVQCEVRPVFMVAGEDGRPVGPVQAPETWVLAHRELEGLKPRIEALEAELTARANQDGPAATPGTAE